MTQVDERSNSLTTKLQDLSLRQPSLALLI